MRVGPALVMACATLAAAPSIQTFALPSGLRCVLLEKHDQPLIRLELVTRWDTESKPGLAGFLACLMRAGGAGPYTRMEFNGALDDQGITFDFESRRNQYRWTLATDSRSQEPALELLADAVFRPVFDVPMVEAQKGALAGDSPWDRGRARFLWGLGDEATDLPPSLGPLEFEELQAFRRRVVRPEASILVLHGDLSLTQARELVFLHFGLWGPGPRPPAAPPPPSAAPEPRLLVVPEGTGEIELWAGRSSSGCDPAVRELLEGLLGQVPRVLAPGIVSECSLERGRPLLVKVKAGPGGRQGLLGAFQDALGALRARGFSQLDLERARARWRARMAVLPLHPKDQLSRFQEGVLDPEFQRRVEAVGVKEVNDALGALLAPEALRYLLLGGDAALVAALGPAEILN